MLPGVFLADVIDCRRCQDGVWFVPALFDFEEGERLSREDFFTQMVFDDDRFRQVEQRYFVDTDPPTFWSLWLRARITAEFRMQPLIAGDTSRTSILDIGFVAVIFGASSEPTFHPFVCGDGEGEGPELEFLHRVTTHEEQKRIASAFRTLMLARTLDLATFADYCTLDADYEFYFVKLGLDAQRRFFALEVAACDYYDVEPGWNDGHAGLPGCESRECDECGGLGSESFLPAGEECETCCGSGRVSWVDPWAPRKRRPKSAFRDW